MKFCPECGKPLPSESVKYCSECGYRLALVSAPQPVSEATPSTAEAKASQPQQPSRTCPRCGAALAPNVTQFCPSCAFKLNARMSLYQQSWNSSGDSYPEHNRRYSPAWYLLPFLFGFIGGLLAYLGVRNEDEDAAFVMLLLGIVTTVLGVALTWAVWAALFHL